MMGVKRMSFMPTSFQLANGRRLESEQLFRCRCSTCISHGSNCSESHARAEKKESVHVGSECMNSATETSRGELVVFVVGDRSTKDIAASWGDVLRLVLNEGGSSYMFVSDVWGVVDAALVPPVVRPLLRAFLCGVRHIQLVNGKDVPALVMEKILRHSTESITLPLLFPFSFIHQIGGHEVIIDSERLFENRLGYKPTTCQLIAVSRNFTTIHSSIVAEEATKSSAQRYLRHLSDSIPFVEPN